MTLIPTAQSGLTPSGIFSTDGERYIKGANVIWADADTAQATQVDSITLEVKDNDGTVQYLLTTISTPGINLESPANVYTADDIRVTGFPDGYVTLTWSAELDDYDYTSVNTIPFNTTKNMVFTTGQTETLESYKMVLGQPKTFTTRVVDSVQNAVDGYAVQLVFYDRDNSNHIAYIDVSNAGTGLGLYQHTYTPSTSNFSADLDRYEVYWRIQLSEGGSWYEITNSRHPLKVYGEATDVSTGPITYSTNQDVRITFPGIDAFLSDLVPNQGEREILLNHKRLHVSNLISGQIKNTRVRKNRELLRQWECYEVYRQVLLNAMGFAKFAASDTQLQAIDLEIKKIKAVLFSPISTVRIGGRL